MRDRIFSSVLLPAPLRPTMPTTSPGATEKVTPFSAQSMGAAVPFPPESAPRIRRHAPAGASTSVSRSDPYVNAPRGAPRRYRLPIPSIRIASDDIGEGVFHPLEKEETADEQRGRDGHRRPQHRTRRRG